MRSCVKYIFYSTLAATILGVLAMLTIGTLQALRAMRFLNAASVFRDGTTSSAQLTSSFARRAQIGRYMEATGDLSRQLHDIAWFGEPSNLGPQIEDSPAYAVMLAGAIGASLLAAPCLGLLRSPLRGLPIRVEHAHATIMRSTWRRVVLIAPPVVVVACAIAWWITSDRSVVRAEALGQWPSSHPAQAPNVEVAFLCALISGGLLLAGWYTSLRSMRAWFASNGMCAECGYDLAGSSAHVCSECGAPGLVSVSGGIQFRHAGRQTRVPLVVATIVALGAAAALLIPTARQWVFLDDAASTEPFIVVRGDECLEIGASSGHVLLAWRIVSNNAQGAPTPIDVICAWCDMTTHSSGVAHQPAIPINSGQSWKLPIVTPYCRLNVYASGSGQRLRTSLDGLVTATCDDIHSLRRFPATSPDARVQRLQDELRRTAE